MVELKKLILQRPTWLETPTMEQESIVLDTRVELTRNLEKFPFPSRASLLEKQQIFKVISQSVADHNLLDDNHLSLNLQEMSTLSKTLLFERNMIDLPLLRGLGDRGVLVSLQGTTLAINGKNHLSLFKTSHKESSRKLWEDLDAIDTKIGSELTYAYDEKRGFLQSKSDESGTGLSITSTLHLPGLLLTSTLDQVLSGVAQLGLGAEGKFRQGNDAWGSLFTITAGAFAGENEAEIIARHNQALQEVILHETTARDLLFSKAPVEMTDKIWRSYGVLKYCRLLSVPQLLNLSSALRLGIERKCEGFPLTLENLNSLIAAGLQGSVALFMDEEATSSEDLDEQRAQIVRSLMG